MSNAVLSHLHRLPAIPKLVVATTLSAWLGVVLLLGAAGAFVSPPGTPPWPLLLAVVLPVTAFLVAFHVSRPFRNFVLGIDLRLASAVQGWRIAGFEFLTLYMYGVLPGMFALPAGLGDMAIGMVAPWIVLSLSRDRAFAASSAFRSWNLLGILDLVVAVSLGGLNSALASGVSGEITTAPMALLPLVLIPAYFVPIFLMLHIAALYQSRRG